MKFGDKLRELLEIKGVSQKQLAQDLMLAYSTLGNYIRNLREPDYEILKKIASYFHVSIDYLLDYHFCDTRSSKEDKVLHIFRSLTADQQELYIEQGKLLLKHNQKEKASPTFTEKNKIE